MAESHDCWVVVSVAGAVGIDVCLIIPVDIVRDGVGVRTKLYGSEGGTCPWERMAHSAGSNKGIDESHQWDILLRQYVGLETTGRDGQHDQS
jgi:hypothetical protein